MRNYIIGSIVLGLVILVFIQHNRIKKQELALREYASTLGHLSEGANNMQKILLQNNPEYTKIYEWLDGLKWAARNIEYCKNPTTKDKQRCLTNTL